MKINSKAAILTVLFALVIPAAGKVSFIHAGGSKEPSTPASESGTPDPTKLGDNATIKTTGLPQDPLPEPGGNSPGGSNNPPSSNPPPSTTPPPAVNPPPTSNPPAVTATPPTGPTPEEKAAAVLTAAQEAAAGTAKTEAEKASAALTGAEKEAGNASTNLAAAKASAGSADAALEAARKGNTDQAAAMATARGNGGQVQTALSVVTQNYAQQSVYTQNAATGAAAWNGSMQNTLQAEPVGDPVLATTGRYILEEEDLRVGDIPVTRSYVSEVQGGGTYGARWISSLDTRIIRGTSAVDRSLLEAMRLNTAILLDSFTRVKTQTDKYPALLTEIAGQDQKARSAAAVASSRAGLALEAARLADGWAFAAADASSNAEKAASSTVPQSGGALGWASKASASAESARQKADDAERDSAAANEPLLGPSAASGAAVDSIAVLLAEAQAARGDAEQYLASLHQMYLEAKRLTDTAEAEAGSVERRASSLRLLNRYSQYPLSPAQFQETGNESLVLIDERGAPITYAFRGNGAWLPVDAIHSKTDRIESIDGNGAETEAGFILHTKGGTKKYYSRWGLLTAIVDRRGNRTDFDRDDKTGKVRSIRDTNRKWELSYAGGLLAGINGPENLKILYSYSGTLLSGVTDADGDLVSFDYEDGRLKKIIKPDGSFVDLVYGFTQGDRRHLVTETRHEESRPGERGETFEYFPEKRRTVHTNESGVVTEYRYDGQHRTVREIRSDGTDSMYEYDETTGNLDSMTKNGDVTGYRWDSRGNRTETAYSDGSGETWAWNETDQISAYCDRDGVKTEWVYDGRGNCLYIYRDGKQIFEGSYNDRGLLASSRTGERSAENYTYDINGYLEQKTVCLGTRTIGEKWKHDALGRILSHTDANGETTFFSYSGTENGRLVTETTPMKLERKVLYNNRKDPVKITETDLRTGEKRTTETEYDRRHLPLKVTDGAGNKTDFAWRADGMLLSETKGAWKKSWTYHPSGQTASLVISKKGSADTYTETYNWGGSFPGETETVTRGGTAAPNTSTTYARNRWMGITAVTNALGETSARTLSPEGRLTGEQTGWGGAYRHVWESGRLAQTGKEYGTQEGAAYNGDGTVASITDRRGVTTGYRYDGRGLAESETSPGRKQTFLRDNGGRLVRTDIMTDTSAALGASASWTEWDYADGGRVVTVTEGSLYPTVWQLNAWGEPVKKTDGEGNETSWSYDGNGNPATSSDGYGRVTSYAWNEIGLPESTVHPDGTKETFEYNHLGQMTKITDDAGMKLELTYDSLGRPVRERGRPGVDRSYSYDAVGRITEVKTGNTVTETYRYEDRGRTIRATTGSGHAYTSRLDDFGLYSGETNRLGDSRSVQYDGADRVARVTAFSGKSQTVGYDDANGVTSIRYQDGMVSETVRDASHRVIEASAGTGKIAYRYDAGGRLRLQSDAGEETRYGYDRSGRRILMESGNREVSWRYGKNGELLSVTDNKQRLSASFTYDAMGRETGRRFGNGAVQETKYDAVGRIIMIRELSPARELIRAEAYVYDAEGRRRSSVDEKGRATIYEYDGLSRLAGVLYPWSEEKEAQEKTEAERYGLFVPSLRGNPERIMLPLRTSHRSAKRSSS